MLLCGGAMLLLLSYFFGKMYFISTSLIDLLTYVWGRKNSTARMQAGP